MPTRAERTKSQREKERAAKVAKGNAPGPPNPAISASNYRRNVAALFTWGVTGVIVPAIITVGGIVVSIALQSLIALALVGIGGVWVVATIVLDKRLKHRFVWSFLTAIAFSGLIWMIRIEVIKAIQESVYVNLSAKVSMDASDDPLLSVFILTNGSQHVIGQHQIMCDYNSIVGNDGRYFTHDANGYTPDSGAKMLPGESQSEQCLRPLLNFVSMFGRFDAQCLDVTIRMDYSLEVQPDTYRQRPFRFVSYRGPRGFSWYPERVGDPRKGCDSFARFPRSK